MSRAATAAAVEKIVHKDCSDQLQFHRQFGSGTGHAIPKASEESRRLEETQVFVFKIQACRRSLP